MNKTLYTFTMCATAMLFGCAPADQDGAMELSTVKTDDELSAKIELLFDKYIQNEWDVMDLYAEDVVCKINNVEFSGRDNLMGGFKCTTMLSTATSPSRTCAFNQNTGVTGKFVSLLVHLDRRWPNLGRQLLQPALWLQVEDGRIAELHGYWSEDVQKNSSGLCCSQRERMISA